MPVFTMLLSFIALPFTCVFDKPMIIGIAMVVGIVADVIFAVVSSINKKDTTYNGFAIDWGA